MTTGRLGRGETVLHKKRKRTRHKARSSEKLGGEEVLINEVDAPTEDFGGEQN